MSGFFGCFQCAALVFFVVVLIGRVIYLRASKGIRSFALGVGKKGIQGVVERLFFVFLVLWMIEVVVYALRLDFHIFSEALHWSLIDALFVRVIGTALIVVGLVVFVMALVAFGDSWRVGIDKNAPGEMVATGIFAVARNPIFLSVDLYFAGTFLVNGTLIFLLFAALVVLGMHYQILQEERFLEETYGEAYRRYRGVVGRYLTLGSASPARD